MPLLTAAYCSPLATVYSGNWYSMDVTEIVQFWVNDTYPNYGFTIMDDTEANENHWTTFYSSDAVSPHKPELHITYTDATVTPTISLNKSSMTVLEGRSMAITATTSPSGVAVTWSTSNSAVATVNNSGVVTAVKAGIATITAAVPGGYASCIVYVTLADRFYYIQNAYSGCCLGTSGGIVNRTDVQVLSKALEYPGRLYQLWKIKHIGNGHYSVRPMNKMDMLLNVTGTNVDILQSSAADTYSNLPSYLRWKISYTPAGYIFQNDGSVYKTMQPAGGSSAAGSTVSVGTYNNTTVFCWTLEKVQSPLPGAVLYLNNQATYTGPTLYIAPGESRTLSNMGLHAVGYSTSGMTESFTWSSNSANVIVNSTTGEVTGVSHGTVQITGNSAYGHVYYYLEVQPIANGTYFIQHAQTEQFADINTAVNTTLSGGSIYRKPFSGSSPQKWVFTHLGDGTYSIHSANSTTAYYMTVQGGATTTNAPIVLQSGSVSDAARWKIEVTARGTYKLTAFEGDTNNLVLVPKSNDTTLVQNTFTNTSPYPGDWRLIGYTDSTFIAIPEPDGRNRVASFPSVLASLRTMGYQSNRQLDYANETMVAALMASSKVFFSRSHGTKTDIQLNNYYYFSIDTLSSCADGALSNCELVLYGACLTGEGREGADNLVNATAAAGVQAVVGFDDTVLCDEVNIWAEQFFAALRTGHSVYTACELADIWATEIIRNEMQLNGQDGYEQYVLSTNCWYTAGDDSVQLN